MLKGIENMNSRTEPRIIITPGFEWQSLVAEHEEVIADVVPGVVVCQANAAVVAFKGKLDGGNKAFVWELYGRKKGGPDVLIAKGTGNLGTRDVNRETTGEIVYASELVISESSWFSDVDVISETDYYAFLVFDLFGFNSLVCKAARAAVAPCDTIASDVTWL
jgi:hypothetical protein